MAAHEGMSLDELAERCVVALGARPEVQEVVAFGSYADGGADAYSDLDLRVVSEDYPLTVRCLPETLARIDDPLIMLLIGDGPDEAAWAVLFAHRPLWQKLDIGIRRPGRLGSARSLYHRPAGASAEPAALTPDPALGDIPACSALTHGLYDTAIGATRYVKSRPRGQPLTANRFYQPVLRTLFAVSHNAAAGREIWAPFGSREYPALDAIADPALERATSIPRTPGTWTSCSRTPWSAPSARPGRRSRRSTSAACSRSSTGWRRSWACAPPSRGRPAH